MRTLGLIGGMSAESTALYYAHLNRLARERLGGLHSARLVIVSIDFAPLAEMQAKGEWEAAGLMLAEEARRLQAAGAEAILICANTMHLVADAVQAAVDAPVLHIADATADRLQAVGSRRPLLLATRFTMEKDFYRDRLAARGIDAVVPEAADRQALHAIIYDELCQGLIRPPSKAAVLEMIGRARGIDGVIFGCTEIGLLISPDELTLPVVDTTLAHAEAAMDFALG
ncbi:MAG: aspartate/glutamate racemase family protein [Phenylobacterium sp.]|uniref:aspartate/glutamate racemase family protein n=1 Tax=Phenylobacterium sp. TaxID=1871053 RepID=UPI00391B12D4